ncbi:hypothetical protein MKZ38_008794 [Zalerion maritima]|uniref:Uncharacterized protein n=1 Tax=Zalerion maritima TaxID=339359 RepID=A0AAD5RGR2_9PEZI|nr:hypothetical protein MKZ38_008794 [Zalerion maritima]
MYAPGLSVDVTSIAIIAILALIHDIVHHSNHFATTGSGERCGIFQHPGCETEHLDTIAEERPSSSSADASGSGGFASTGNDNGFHLTTISSKFVDSHLKLRKCNLDYCKHARCSYATCCRRHEKKDHSI